MLTRKNKGRHCYRPTEKVTRSSFRCDLTCFLLQNSVHCFGRAQALAHQLRNAGCVIVVCARYGLWCWRGKCRIVRQFFGLGHERFSGYL